jgi:YqaJ-like viral recombinase domain
VKIISCSQGSQEWFEARAGRVTASNVADVLAFLKRGDKKGGETAARASYKAQIVAETLSGSAILDGYLSSFMQHGTEMEPFARAAYEVRNNVSVDTVGFIVHPTIDRFGASPDGLIGKDGGIEIKAPKTATHIDYMLAGILPPEYEPQVMSNIDCAEREWWDFLSFDDRLPSRHQQFKVRTYRDEARIAQIDEGVRLFLQEVDDLIGELQRLNPEIAALPAEDYGDLGITGADILACDPHYQGAKA